MKKIHPAWLVLAGCCVMPFSMGATMNSMGQYFVPISSELGFTIGQITIQLTIQSLCGAFMAPISGKLISKAKIKPLLFIGYSIVLGCLALASTYTQLWQWYLSAAVIGISGSFCFLLPTSMIINNWFSEKTGFAIGLCMAFSGVGGAIMNSLIAYIIPIWGWRSAYVFNACFVALLAFPSILFLIRFKPADIGVLPYGAENAALAASGENNASQGEKMPLAKTIKTLSFACLFVSLGIVAFTSGFSQHLATHSSDLGFVAAFGGSMVSTCMIGNIAFKFILGGIRDKFGSKPMVWFGLGVSGISFLLLIFFKIPSVLLVAAFMCGITMSMTSVAFPLLIREVFGQHMYNDIYPIMTFGQSIIYACGVTLVGRLYDTTGGHYASFAIAAIGCAIVVFLVNIAFAKKTVTE